MDLKRFKKLYSCRNILWDLALAQLKSKYAGSFLGIWWAVVTPVILAASISFVFSLVFKIKTERYGIFVLSGIMPWFFLNSALSETTNSFIANASLLRQAVFPRELIPISTVLANLLNSLIGLIFLMPLFVIYNFKIILFLPWLILALPLYFLFVLGLGFLFSSINIFHRDFSHFLSAIFMIWFWVTPVFYSIDSVPLPYQWVFLINPVTYFINLYQLILFKGSNPSFLNMAAVFLLSFCSLAAGYGFFLKKESLLLKRI